MSDVVWSIDSRKDNIDDLVDRMKDFLLEITASLALQYQIKTEGFENLKKLPVNIKQNTYLIFKEAVNNTIKHSNADKIEVHLKVQNKQLIVHIKDNGTLSKNKGRLPGQGLQNMKMRAKKLGGTAIIENSNGFSIKLSLPL